MDEIRRLQQESIAAIDKLMARIEDARRPAMMAFDGACRRVLEMGWRIDQCTVAHRDHGVEHGTELRTETLVVDYKTDGGFLRGHEVCQIRTESKVGEFIRIDYVFIAWPPAPETK